MLAQTVVVVLLLAVTAVFALMNPALVEEIWTVRIPGASFTGPVLSMVLLLAAGALLVFYAGTTFWYYSVTNRMRKLEQALAKQGGAVPADEADDASRKIVKELTNKIDGARVELSEQIIELGRIVEDRLRDLAAQMTEPPPQ